MSELQDFELKFGIKWEDAVEAINKVGETLRQIFSQTGKASNAIFAFMAPYLSSLELKRYAKLGIKPARVELARRGIYRKRFYR